MAAIQKFDNSEDREDIYYKMTKLVKYLSTKEVQKESFKAALNVPAFKGADEYIASLDPEKDDISKSALDMAKAQTAMNEFGIAQPFVDGKLNTYYYQSSAPDYYEQGIRNDSGIDKEYYDTSTVRRVLFLIEYVWRNGKRPDISKISSTLPAASDKQ